MKSCLLYTSCNPYYDAMPAIVQEYMDKVNAKIGTDYKLFNYYGAADAEHIIIAMGSVCDTIEETIDYLTAAGQKVGVVKVRLYRPFSAEALVAAIPETVKQISVLDRTKEPGALGEPLYLDVVAALKGTKFHDIPVFTGRYGLGSKDTTPAQIVAVYNNSEKQKFTIGIEDDVTNLSLKLGDPIVTTPAGTINCKFWGCLLYTSFRAIAEATEEAVLNSLAMARTVTGYDGTVKYSLADVCLDQLAESKSAR